MQGTVSQKAFRGDCFSNIWIAKIQAAILAINRITALLLPSNKKAFKTKPLKALISLAERVDSNPLSL
jgi:hypothetical protein